MSNNSRILEVKNIYKSYFVGNNLVEVIKGVDLTVTRGENIVITGSSGAGKSTMLHILGLLDVPDKGEVLIEGKDAYSINERERASLRNTKIGFVFQFYHLLPEFTALENVLIPSFIRSKTLGNAVSRKQLDARAYFLLKEVGLAERTFHKPNQLSGGEQQRVAIVRALMNEPDILLCDEPTGNLDSKSGEAICELLKLMNEVYKQTIIIATHEEKITKLAKRTLHIKDGKIKL